MSGLYRDQLEAAADKKARRAKNTRNWNARNPEKRRAIALAWAKRNPEKLRAQKAIQRARDPIKMRKWAIENPEKMAACRKSWDLRNMDRKTMHAANRRGRKYQATPAWTNEFFVAEIYSLAQLRTKLTGIQWEVDHIVPLGGKRVCGLHCEQNMQVIPLAQNRRKAHFYWPDMP